VQKTWYAFIYMCTYGIQFYQLQAMLTVSTAFAHGCTFHLSLDAFTAAPAPTFDQKLTGLWSSWYRKPNWFPSIEDLYHPQSLGLGSCITGYNELPHTYSATALCMSKKENLCRRQSINSFPYMSELHTMGFIYIITVTGMVTEQHNIIFNQGYELGHSYLGGGAECPCHIIIGFPCLPGW
jgi:hypothetical protein